MDITLLFEKVFGLYLIIAGLLVILRKEEMMSLAKMYGKDMALRFAMGGLLLLGGLFMVITYYDFSTLPTSIITLVGWLVFAKGFIFFFASEKKVQKLIGMWSNSGTYMAWGVIALIAGGYLALLGFGFVA